MNMRNNLDLYFEGDWTLQYVGTCTRQTGVSNVPESVNLSGIDLAFNQSGVGFSFSGTSFENLIKPEL